MEDVQKIIDRPKQADGSYGIKKYRHTSADIVWYETGELDEYGDPIQTSVQDEIDNIKENTKNIPNVSTNDQTPTYTEAETLVKLTSGEKLSVAFGKISKAITDFIAHIGDNVRHITSTERLIWNDAKYHADTIHAPANAQENIIETIKVNGTILTPTEKEVDIPVPNVGNGTIKFTQNGVEKGSFTTNQSGDATIELTDSDTIYELPEASSTLGGVKTTSKVTDVTDYTPCPIVEGVPYFKEGSGGSGEGSIAISKDVPITLLSSGWIGDTAPYQQLVECSDIRAGMTPVHFLASEDSGNDNAEYAYSLITDCVSDAGTITFYASDLPDVDLHIVLKGIPSQQLDYVDNSVLIPVDHTLFTLNEETQRYEQTITVDGMTEGLGGTFDILRSGAVLTEQESLIIANITDIVRQDGSIKIICLEQPTDNYTLVLYGTFTQATDETTLIANMNGWFTRVENLENRQYGKNSNSDDEIVIGTYNNKPLYRKQLLHNFEMTTGETDIDVSDLNIDNYVRFFGDANYGSTHKLPFGFASHDGSTSFAFYQNNDNKIYVRTVLNNNLSASVVTLYIEYTKTTDDPIG